MKRRIAALLRKSVGRSRALRALARPHLTELFPETDAETLRTIELARPYSMTTAQNLWTTIKAVEYIEAKKLPGVLVEAGVWRGGQAMAMALTLKRLGSSRPIWLYDTFEGMPEPTDSDINARGDNARERFDARARDNGYSDWAYASQREVERNLKSTEYSHLRFIVGKVEDTLTDRANIPEAVALLRLDTDWYESTKAELEILYPLVPSGGVVVVDDYGSWQGARKAVDEYFRNDPVLFQYVDAGARLAIKL